MLNEKCQERHNKGKDRPVSSRGLSRTPGEGFSVPLEKALNMGVVRNAATSATALHEDDSKIYYSGSHEYKNSGGALCLKWNYLRGNNCTLRKKREIDGVEDSVRGSRLREIENLWLERAIENSAAKKGNIMFHGIE
ncbi:hypothetical protein RUM44_007606 [Polyplax serrata]|uniref:Uncharacterized protein n=1 Tax=Polyplax serrata TaxID=468196 RepID=A0ABR1B9Z9_POLSC